MTRVFQALLLLIVFSNTTFAAPSAELWNRWTQHDPQSTKIINHTAWDSFLGQYTVVRTGWVSKLRYKSVAESDLAHLADYLNRMSKIEISQYNRDEQRAFWINLYNALTIKVVLQHYPIRSIRNVSSGLFTSGPWKLELVQIEGENLTLDDIEHRILRPIWQDPRLHYAVNCASIGCPNLQPRAFTAMNAEALLDNAAREFINHPRAVRVNNDKNLRISSLYHWFIEDFGGNDAGIIKHLRQYANPKLSQTLKGIEIIHDHHYDWSLNSLVPANLGNSGRIGS